MGVNSSCSNCCIEKEFYANIRPNTSPTDINDGEHPGGSELLIVLPRPSYGKPVNSIIDMNPIVRKTYKEQSSAIHHVGITAGGSNRIQSLQSRVLQAYYIFGINAYYEGEWREGLPHGQGRLHFDDGSLYQGILSQGVIECERGLYIFPNGDYYKGSIQKNKASGQGTLKYNEIYYVGGWSDNLPSGEGTEIYEGIFKYKGQFKNGMKHGEGTFVWPEIGTYEGSFYANFIQGRGVLKLVNSTYEGWFYKNKKHGKGKLCYSNGDTYEGEFSNDMKQGLGTFTWSSGEIYIGNFHMDLQHNHGKLQLTDGTVIEGEWRNGFPPEQL